MMIEGVHVAYMGEVMQQRNTVAGVSLYIRAARKGDRQTVSLYAGDNGGHGCGARGSEI